MLRKNVKLRSHLIALVVVAVLPVVIFAGVVAYLSYQQQRADLSRGMIDTARALSTALDREFLISIQSLKVLATSSHLDKGELSEFYGEMKRALAAYGRAWQNIALLDSSGQELINLRLPFGSPLPRVGSPELLERIVKSQEAAVSDLFRGPVTGAPSIVVGVPVLKDGQVKYLINAGVSPLRLIDLLSQQKLPPGWIASIIDRNKIILARTQVPEKFVGTPATPTLAAKTRESEEGWFQGVTKDNVAVYMAFSRSRLSGWTVALGIPIAGVEASLKRSLVLTGIGGFALLLVAVALAAVLARRIGRPVSALSSAAEKLGRGETPKIPPSQIAEINQVGRALETAAAQRAQAEEALRRSEQQLKLSLDAARMGIWDVNLVTGEVSWSHNYETLFGLSPGSFPRTREAFLALVHPEDRNGVDEVFRHAIEVDAEYSQEFRICWPDGSVHWILGVGRASRDDTGRPVRVTGVGMDITERKQAEQALQARYLEQQWLHEISELILTSPDLKVTAATIIDKALSASLCDLGVIRLLTSATGRLEAVASRGYQDPENLKRHRNNPSLPGSRGEIMRFFTRKETIVLERVRDELGMRTFKREGIESLIMVPVVAGQEILGLLQLGSRRPRKFEPDLINFLETLGSHFGIALQKTTLLEEALVGQARLRSLSRRLVEAQETERRNIARELHDEIGSLLTGLKLVLEMSARSGTDPTNRESTSAQSLIGELFAKVRSLSHSLRPPMLDDLGLPATLSWHVKEFTARTNVRADLQHEGLERRFPAEVEITAYRIVQEALTNIARHAQIQEVSVRLWADQSVLGIEISDQGAGFDQTTVLARASGGGLTGMRERVAQLGGSIKITSDPGAGTCITVELPLGYSQ